MCNKLTSAATALLTALLAAASPALADSGVKSAPGAVAQAPPPAAAKPVSAQDRAAVDRLEPLARAAFWANELGKYPADTEAGVKLAVALRQLGRAQEAYNTLQQVLAIQPDNVEALLETARAAIAGDQGFYAIAPAKKVQALRPKDWRAPTLLGVAYEQTRQPELALAAHRQAVALAPNNPAALCNLGMFLAANGDPAQGESLLRKAVAQPDATTQVRQDLALILGLQGKLAESEQLQRLDLPPDQADNNIAYLKAAASPAPAALRASPGANASADRSWSALAKAEAQDQTPIN